MVEPPDEPNETPLIVHPPSSTTMPAPGVSADVKVTDAPEDIVISPPRVSGGVLTEFTFTTAFEPAKVS